MKRRAGIGILAVVIALVFGVMLRGNSHSQSGSAAQYEQENQIPAEGLPETCVSDPKSAAFEEAPEDGTLIWQGETYKRNAHVKADLLMGIDPQGAADALFVAVHDTARNTLKLLMIPRDSMLEMTEVTAEGKTRQVVTHVTLSHSGPGTPEEKAKRTVGAVEALLCGTGIDHYMAGDISMIAGVSDLAGGIPVIVPNEELKKADPAWKKGERIVLHGSDAERFIRFRDIETDGTPLLRMDQHKAYIAGFYQRLREDKTLPGKLADYIEDAVTSDMSKGEYEKMLLDGLLCGFDPEKDILILPGEMTTGEEDGAVYDQFFVNYEEEIPVLLDLFYRKVS